MVDRSTNNFNDLNSYDSLTGNGKFVSKAESVLHNIFGEDEVYEDSTEVIDAFYEKFRQVDVNTLYAHRLFNKLGDIDEDTKNNLRDVYQVYRSLPTFWEDDTASNGQAFIDYALGIFKDPTTYASFVGGSGVAAKIAATALVQTGIKNATKAGLRGAALTSIGVDTASSVLGDAYIQNTEKELDLRDSYSVSEGALVAGASILPVAALTAAVPAMKAGYRSLRPSATDIVGSVAEGKRVYLEGSDAGKAYMNNEIVEGSFVQIPSKAKKVLREDKFIDENLGYVESIDKTNKTATINTGFSDETGDPIQKTISLNDINLEDPFSQRVRKKIDKQVLKDAQLFNKAAAKEGFENLQKQIIKTLDLKVTDMTDFSFKLNQDSIERLNKAYIDIIAESKMIYNPNKRISQNVGDAIRYGINGFNHANVAQILKYHRISDVEFAAFLSGGYMGTISDAAVTLSKQSKLKNQMEKEFLSALNGGINARFKKMTRGIKPEEYYISLASKAKTKLDEKVSYNKVGGEADPAAFEDVKIKDAISDMVGNKDLSPEAERYFIQLFAERGKTDKWLRSLESGSTVNRIIRLGMISQPATTVRNILGGLIRSPVDAVTRTFDNAITSALPMVGGGPQARPVNWVDGWDHISSIFSPQEHRILTEFIATKKPDIQKQLFSGPEAYKESMEIVNNLQNSKTGIINRTSSGIEKAFIKANFLNGLQDRYMKSQAFITGLKHSMWRDGKDLLEYVKRGDIESIDDRFIQEGIEWALEFNYQTPGLEKYPIADVLNKVSKWPFGAGAAIMPFPKFFFNSVRFMYQHSPIATVKTAVDLGIRKAKGAELGPLSSFEKQRYIRRLSQQMAGGSLILTAFALRNSEYAGDKWNELLDYDNGILDITTWYPLAPALYIAEGIKQILDFKDAPTLFKNSAEVFGWEPSKEYRSGSWTDVATNYNKEWFTNFGKAFGGPSTRSGIFKLLQGNYLATLISEDYDNSQIAKSLLGQYTGSVLSAIIQPVKLLTDIGKTFNLENEARIYRGYRDSAGFTTNFLNVVLKDTPLSSTLLMTEDQGLTYDDKGRVTAFTLNRPKNGELKPSYQYSILNPEPLKLADPLLKQVTGAFKKRERNLVEGEFARLGIEEWRLFRPTRIPEFDRFAKAILGSVLAGPLHNFVTSDVYQKENDLVTKAEMLQSVAQNLKNQFLTVLKDHHDYGIILNINRVKPSVKRKVKEWAKQIAPEMKTGEYSLKELSTEELKVLKEMNKMYKKHIKTISKAAIPPTKIE